ncbi:MAG TPA: hypothetical protein VGR96_15885 [Acidobacteriaceae bacterium]|nr:hypothetical protein [Acidobacteriaceae bacterium]
MTAQQIITQAMQEVGALDFARVPSGPEAQFGFQKLNQLVELWNIQKRLLWGSSIQQATFPSSKQSYTIGPSAGADFNFARPTRIDWMNIVLTSQTPAVYLPVTLLQTKEWLSIPVPFVGTSIPIRAYYDQGFVSTPGAAPALATPGLATIYFNPYPTAPLPDMQWMSAVQITSFADLTTDYLFAPAYQGALIYSLAETLNALSPPADNMTYCIKQAAIWRAKIRGNNHEPPRTTPDWGLGSLGEHRGADFNWLTGNVS